MLGNNNHVKKPSRTRTRVNYITLIDVPAIFISFRQWDVANPRTTKPVFSCIRTFLRALVSTIF